MTLEAQGDHTALLSASACSVEIFVHQLLLLTVLLPFTLLIFPFLTFHIGTSLLNVNLTEDWRQWKSMPAQQDSSFLTETQEMSVAVALTILVGSISGVAYRRSLKHQDDASNGRRYRPLKGDRGLALRQRVETLWLQVASQTTAIPEVLWFPNAGVLARAMIQDRRSAIAVSTGLWERVESDDPVVRIILLHELAHLTYKDPIRFARLASVLQATNRSLKILVRVLACVVIFLLIQQGMVNARAHMANGSIFRQEIMILAIGILALSLCPVAASIVRRYVGFITSLIELRADVCSAQWAGGLNRFGETLKAHPMVHQSTLSDRARSWFSLDLTHLSETERVEAVSNPQRLLTPKIEYFIFSLVLALLLPINGLTPLFEGGIVDLAATLAVALALMFAVSTMLIIAGGTTIGISLARLLALSIALTLFIAASRINLYTLTYSLSTIAVEVGLPPSGSPLPGSHFWNDILSAFHDIRDQLLTTWSHGWILISVAISTAALALVVSVARKWQRGQQPKRLLLTVVAAISGMGILVDGYDPWRAFTIDGTIFGRICQYWAAVGDRFPGIRFTLGPCLAAFFLLVLWVLSFLRIRKTAAT